MIRDLLIKTAEKELKNNNKLLKAIAKSKDELSEKQQKLLEEANEIEYQEYNENEAPLTDNIMAAKKRPSEVKQEDEDFDNLDLEGEEDNKRLDDNQIKNLIDENN